MPSAKKIQGLLCCPNCRGHLDLEIFPEDELGIQEGRLYCPICKQDYAIGEGIFYLHPRSEITASSKDWDLDAFNKVYGGIGSYRNGVEWGEYLNIPRQFSNYIEPRVKGRLFEWFESPDYGTVLKALYCLVSSWAYPIVGGPSVIASSIDCCPLPYRIHTKNVLPTQRYVLSLQTNGAS